MKNCDCELNCNNCDYKIILTMCQYCKNYNRFKCINHIEEIKIKPRFIPRYSSEAYESMFRKIDKN